jgi:hypothetical protein
MSGKGTEQQTTPTDDLDVIVREGLEIFDPGDQTGEPGQETVISGPAKKEDAPEEKTPEQLQAEAAAVEAEAARKAAAFRFKTHEAAEKGYKDIQGEKTRAEQRAAELEAENKALKDADRLKQEKADGDQAYEEFATQRHMQALDEIDKLDPDDAEYRKKVAQCWARSTVDIRNHEPAAPAPAVSAPAPKAAAPEVTDDPNPKEEEIRGFIKDTIAGQGLDREDPLFWHFAELTPSKDEKGNPLDLETQINWSLEQVKNYHSRIVKKPTAAEAEAEAKEKAENLQRQEMPMGRTGTGRVPTSAEDDKPVTMADAVDHAQGLRRL